MARTKSNQANVKLTQRRAVPYLGHPTNVRRRARISVLARILGQCGVVATLWLGAARCPAESSKSHSPRAAQPVAAAPSRADEAFEAGVAAYRRGDYASARESFTLAYELDASYRHAAVLGQTEEKLGHLAQAATLLNWALFHMDADVEPDAKARVNADLKLLKSRILTIKLVTAVPFQEVLIDDLLFSSNSLRILPAGEDSWTIYLDPATRRVVVRSEGYDPQERKVTEPPGTFIDWKLHWQPSTVAQSPSEPPRPVSAPPNSTATPSDSTPRVTGVTPWQLSAAIATGGLALVGAGFGLYSLGQYASASDDFDAARSELLATGQNYPCLQSSSANTRDMCASFAAASNARVTHGNRAVVALSAAGGLALTSAALWIWWANTKDDQATEAKWLLVPAVGMGTWGAAAGYQF